MTSDLGDSKEVSEDLEQCQFEVESTSKVKSSSQALNPNADVFYSSSNPTASLEEEPLVKGEDSFVHDESSEPKSEPMPSTMNAERAEVPQAGGQPLSYEYDNTLVQDGQQGPDEPMNYEMKQQIRHALRTQLEYYFSRENLAKDSYLLSQMDSDQYVSISTIANFNQVRNLTRDMDFIVEVLRESPHVQVDEAGEKVRPCHKRCVIILREIPESTPVKEIEDLFKNERCPNYVSCEFAHNNNWYVNFETDEDAQLAYKYLREEVKTFQGKAIMARIKAKPNTRDSFLQPYKNGIRPPTPVDASFPPNQQRFISTVSYGNNAQVCPQMLGAPFYSPTLLQTWSPTTGPPFLDLGTVLTVNGLSPQASFKPMPNTGRLNFSMVRGSSRSGSNKHYGGGRQHQSYEVEHAGRYERNQSLAYIRPPPTALINGAGGYTYMPYPPYPSSRGPYPFGMDLPADYCYPKRMDGHSPLYSSYSQLQSAVPPRAMTKLDKEDSPKMADHIFSLQQPRLNRNRRRKREDGLLGSKPNESESNKSGESSKFDLEPAAFPPLPGAEDDNRLTEVVKGVAKLSTSDAPESVKDSTPLVVSADAVVSPPPSSPVICCEPTTEVNRSYQSDPLSAKCESSSSPSKGRQSVLVPEEGTEEAASTLNGHNDSDSPNFSEDERLPSRRLTYSEVAQRSKSKVEKLAMEMKEKEVRQRQQDPAGGSSGKSASKWPRSQCSGSLQGPEPVPAPKSRYVEAASKASKKDPPQPDPKGSRPTSLHNEPKPPIK